MSVGGSDAADTGSGDERADLAPTTGEGDAPDTTTVDRPPLDEPVAQPSAGLTSRGRVRRTRAGAWWAGLVIAAILMIVLLVFIIQNSQTVSIHLLGLDRDLPLAVALLLAAVAGMLVIAVPGAARILQLRHALRKNARAAAHR